MPVTERSERWPALTQAGAKAVSDVGQAFAAPFERGLERLLPGHPVEVFDVGTPQSTTTATIVAGASNVFEHSDRPLSMLGPGVDGLPALGGPTIADLRRHWMDFWSPTIDADGSDGSTPATFDHWLRAAPACPCSTLLDPVLVIGHDPQMTWTMHALLNHRSASWFSLARGELAWIEIDHSPRLRWVYSPSEPETSEELKAKIKSKMDTAKALGAFLTGLTAFSATQLTTTFGQSRPEFAVLAAGGLVALLASAALYLVTLFWYDELLMPKRFWSTPLAQGDVAHDPRRPGSRGQGQPRLGRSPSLVQRITGRVMPVAVERPPGSDTWILYQGMVRVWSWAFVPATLLCGLGVALVSLALARPRGLGWLAAGVSGVFIIGLVWLFGRIARPELGIND